MPDADPGDLFLRHRGAILDALLSDPYFGFAQTDTVDEAESGPAGGIAAVSAPSGVSAPSEGSVPSGVSVPPVDDSLFITPGSESSERAGRDDDAPPGAEPGENAVPRRSSMGPSASERINALLSGQTPGTGDGFGSDHAQAAADRINREAQDRQENAEQPASAAAPAATEKPTPQQMVQEVTTKLREPKVALAVAVVVALLIVVLLVFTGGERDEQTRPLAIAPPTTSAAPPSPDVPPGGTIEPESAESQCPPGSTEGMDAFSGEPDKAWSCVRAYKVDGQILRIDLGKEYKVDSIGIVPGWDHVGSDGTDQWTKFRTVSRVSYEFGNKRKTTFTQPTLDQRALVVTKIEPPVTTSEIVLTVLKSSGESAANTVAISTIVITGQ